MIPKTIHYCWFGRNPKPKLAEKCIKSWKKYCPDYEIIEWNESNYDFSKIPYMKEAYEAKKWGFVPDYARLDIIYQHGGIYLDTDVEMIRSFNPLLKYAGFAGFESVDYINFGQGFGAEAGNPIIKELMDSYQDMHFIDENGVLDMLPSPRINTPVLLRHGVIADGSYQTIDGFQILPVEYLCPKSFLDGIIRKTRKTFSIHHFSASWFSEEALKTHLYWQKKLKREYYLHAPNRLAKRMLGEQRYAQLKRILGR